MTQLLHRNQVNAPSHLELIDLLRGLAAQLVVLNHMRATFFLDFGSLPDRNPLTIVFYTLTGFGHQGVIIFFVLSGFLVGGAGFRQYLSLSYTPWRFFLRRLTRLWLVLIPALVLTFLIDTIGRHQGVSLYEGAFFDLFTSGPDPSGDIDTSWQFKTLLGNVFFLQTIETSVYGTNSPLWSLAYEFWYYVLFILGMASAASNLPLTLRVASSIGMLIAVVYLPMNILLHGLIWAAGAVLAYVVQTERLPVLPRKLTVLAGIAFAAALLTVRFGLLADFGNLTNDALVAATLIFVLMTVVNRAGLPSWLARFSAFIADYSYTIYLIHFPIVMLIAAVGFSGRQFTLTMPTFALFCAILAALNLFAYLFYRMFESHTPKAQRWIASTFGELPTRLINNGGTK
ncbi:MAG: peptidoglycan/LPS O-acetylase OafA/YrhL [Halioglobus sp.]|jgi:peptidoglycan/LPS O-acetylase OafA/YrhL